MPNPETHVCHTCGFKWKHGQNGDHRCADLLQKRVFTLLAQVDNHADTLFTICRLLLLQDPAHLPPMLVHRAREAVRDIAGTDKLNEIMEVRASIERVMDTKPMPTSGQTVAALRAAGYAVAVFSPEELGNIKAKDMEANLVATGNDWTQP